MNQTSINLMKEIVDRYDLSDKTVVDVGSYDINGTYRALFTGKYIGVDLVAGPNVDILMSSDEWKQMENVDAVISGQTIEHIPDVKSWMSDIFRVIKPGGILCIIGPSEGPPHHYPVWIRNYPESLMCETVAAAGFEILSCTVNQELPWKLVVCVARKSIIEQIEEKSEDQ